MVQLSHHPWPADHQPRDMRDRGAMPLRPIWSLSDNESPVRYVAAPRVHAALYIVTLSLAYISAQSHCNSSARSQHDLPPAAPHPTEPAGPPALTEVSTTWPPELTLDLRQAGPKDILDSRLRRVPHPICAQRFPRADRTDECPKVGGRNPHDLLRRPARDLHCIGQRSPTSPTV